MMMRRTPFYLAVGALLGAWLLIAWTTQTPVDARSAAIVPRMAPLQQSCPNSADLTISTMRVEPAVPVTGVPFNVVIGITNDGGQTSAVDTWTYVFVDRPPQEGSTPDVQGPSATSNLAPGEVITTYLTIPGSFATDGYHSISVRIDGLNAVDESSGGGCGGEQNNTYTLSGILISGSPTATPVPPTPTPFPAPIIYFLEPADTTIVVGQSVTLKWQVYGDAVSVTLDGVPVPLEDQRVITPDLGERVYTLRAENPGGIVIETSRVRVLEPTATPSPTPTACPLAVIHQFNATRTTILRGEETTLYWDLSGATAAYLDGKGVVGVGQKTVSLDQTTIFTLVATNDCGDTQKTLKITVRFATPTATRTPTRTPYPTSTRRPTSTARPATSTPTRRVLPTPTKTVTASPTSLSALESPLGTPAPTATLLPPTPENTPTQAPSPTPDVTPTRQLSMATATPTAQQVVQQATATPVSESDAVAATPTSTPVPSAAGVTGLGSLRMYLCPLGILILFSVSVLILSVILPRIRERDQNAPVETADAIFGASELLPSEGWRVEDDDAGPPPSVDLDDWPIVDDAPPAGEADGPEAYPPFDGSSDDD
jgi:hypothetical protein